MNRLSAAIAALFFLSCANDARAATDPDVKILEDIYSPVLQEGLRDVSKHDYAAAIARIRPLAEQGNAEAQLILGFLYRDGLGVSQDSTQAVAWIRKAAEQGNASGEDNLGWMYHLGHGVPKDDAKALEWIRKSAAKGDTYAQNNLGVMYRDGYGVPKDDAIAVGWFRKAADKGQSLAQNSLGWMYHEGTGVPRDYAQALEWYRKSAAHGDAGAENNLGWSYENGDGVARDPAMAKQWYEKAIAHGNDRAKVNLAAMYKAGDGVPKDVDKAASIMGVSHISTAGASVLKDDIVYTVAGNGTYTDDETTMVRVNLAQSVQRYAQAYLSYSSSLEDLKVLEAYTINKDGKRIDVTPDKIITQQSPISAVAPSFSDVQIKAVVFPDVEPGAVVALHVVKTVKQPLFAGQFSMAEYFPTTSEVKNSRVTLVAPASLRLQVEAIGMQGGAVKSDEAGNNTWIWTLQDASQGVVEPGSINPQDYSPRVAATSFTDYAAAAKAYADGADPKARVTPNVRKLADQITQGTTDPHAKAVAIYNWVSHNIRYVSLTFGLGGVVPHDAETILAARYGDCKDHVVLLQALLSAVGIPSSPVLVNATSVYWQPQIAMSPGVFDHAITYIPQFDVFVDSTAEVAPFGVLPPTEAGKPALVARGHDGKPALVHLPSGDGRHDTTRTTLTATMAADGSVTGTTINADSGQFEFLDRLVAWHVPAGQESQVASALLAQFGAPGAGTLALGDARDLGKSYTYSSTFNISGYANVPGPGSFTIPVGVPGMGGIIGLPHDTATASRVHPIACIASLKIEDSTLTLPASIQVKQLPPAAHLANDIGHYDAIYVQTGQSIRVHRELRLTPKTALCGPQDYQQMRALGAVIARDFRAQVVY